MTSRLPRLFRLAQLLALACVLIAPSSATAAGELALSPDEVDFGEVPSGLSQSHQLTVTNAGPDPVQIGEIGVEGGTGPFSIADGGCLDTVELAGGEDCSLTVTFRAPMDTADYEALLVVEGAGVDPAVASLTASSFFEGYLVSDVAEVRVGPTTIGTTSAPHAVRVRNIGDTPVSIDKAHIYGPPSITPFKVVANGCVGVLEPDQECSIEVVFVPNSFLGVGLQGAPLFVIYPGQIGVLVPLTGEAVAPLSPPQNVPPPGPQEPPPTPSGSEKALARLSTAIPALIRGGPSSGRLLPGFRPAAAGRLNLALFGWNRGKRVRIGGGELRFTASAAKRLRIRLNKRGRALLRRPQQTRIQAITTFRPDSGALSRHTAEYRVKAPKRVGR